MPNFDPRIVIPPVSGTYSRGDIVWATPSSQGPIGYVCVSAGTPGTWAPFGEIKDTLGVTKTIPYLNTGNNATATLLTLTIPNGAAAIRLIVDGIVSRAPSDNVGTSRVFHQEFFIGRTSGADSVIDAALATNNFDLDTTTAGGTSNASSPSLAVAIVSGGPTETQTLRLTGYVGPAFRFIMANIHVHSTAALSTYGL